MLVDEWFAGRILCTPSLRAGSFDPHLPAMSALTAINGVIFFQTYWLISHDMTHSILIKEQCLLQ